METTTKKTTPTVEETTPSTSSLMAEEPATVTTEETTSEVVSEAETPAASEEPAPVGPAAEEPTTETPAETTPVAPDAGETPSTSDEAELPSGIGDESIGGTELTAERARTRIGKALEDFKGFVKKHPWLTLGGTVLVLGMFVGTLFGAIYSAKVNNKVDNLAASNANNGGNNTSIDVPVDHDAEAISKGKRTIDSFLAGYTEYTKEGENFIQNNGTSTTVYYKMKHKSDGETIIVPLTVRKVAANTYEDYYKQLGNMDDIDQYTNITIGAAYTSIASCKNAHTASVEDINKITSTLGQIYNVNGEEEIYISYKEHTIDDGTQASYTIYVDGQGRKMQVSGYGLNSASAAESIFKFGRITCEDGVGEGPFANTFYDESLPTKIAEINKPATQPATPAEGETGAETEDPNASI